MDANDGRDPQERQEAEAGLRSPSRRRFLGTAAAAGAGAVAAAALPASVLAAPPQGAATAGPGDAGQPAAPKRARPGRAMIDTVLGEVDPGSVGKILAHEHLYVDFSLLFGLDDPNYLHPVGGFDAAVDVISTYVEQVRDQGVELIVDWGCLGVGRHAVTVRRVAQRTGVNVAIPTGIYKWLLEPRFEGWSVDRLTDMMVGEFRHGIDGTGIKPALIKLGADPVPTKVETHIHRAAVAAAAETGASVCVHLPFPLDARSETEIARARQLWRLARDAGVPADRFVWGHANGAIKADKVTPAHLDAARAQYLELAAEGATLQFDAVGSDPGNAADPWFGGPTDPQVFLDLLESFVAKGYGDRVMISNDASVYVNPGGGPNGELLDAYTAAGLPNWQYPRDIRYLFGTFEPMLVDRIGADAARQILSTTPARVFSRVRQPSID
jgi:phosphotriesterase-related protein